jgi:hypothetical protein
MDQRWPRWLETDEDEPPPVDEACAYPLHCPRCEGKTESCGAACVPFSTHLDDIMSATDWLPPSYPDAVNAPTATSNRRFHCHTGLWGHCITCKLLVSIQPEGKEGAT